MTSFSAHSNNFFGTLPISLSNCIYIRHLDLSRNALIGELPWWLAFFSNVEILSLGYNNLYGDMPQLHVLDLSNNKFSGRMPLHLERLEGFANASPQLTVSDVEMILDIKGSEYNVSYVLPTNTIFDLSNNNLVGEIPTSIGALRSLRLLNLSGNQLDGLIPVSLGNIPMLEQLDLAKNNLSGQIPKELSKLYELVVFDVSSNNLCGPIPKGTQYSTFGASSFQRNKCLYGCPLDSCIDKESSLREGDNNSNNDNVKVGWLNKVDEKMSLMALGIGTGIGIWVVVGIFIVWKRARHWLLDLPPNKPQLFYGVYRFPT